MAWVAAVGDVELPAIDEATPTRAQVDASAVRCPEGHVAEAMTAVIEAARKQGDTVGGVVRCVVRGVPAGWGAPVFDKLTADLAKAMMSLPASRGFEVGDGFAATKLRGSHAQRPFSKTRRAGQIRPPPITSADLGGSATARRSAWPWRSPVATIFQPQQTVNRAGEAVSRSTRAATIRACCRGRCRWSRRWRRWSCATTCCALCLATMDGLRR